MPSRSNKFNLAFHTCGDSKEYCDNNCLLCDRRDVANKSNDFWHTEEPEEDGEYIVELSNKSRVVGVLDISNTEKYFKFAEPVHAIICYEQCSKTRWHKIPE